MLRTIIVIALAGMAVATSDAAAQEPFYKGKRLTMLINFAPGGGVDVSGRLFARHLARTSRDSPTLSCRIWTAPLELMARIISAKSRPRTAPSWVISAPCPGNT